MVRLFPRSGGSEEISNNNRLTTLSYTSRNYDHDQVANHHTNNDVFVTKPVFKQGRSFPNVPIHNQKSALQLQPDVACISSVSSPPALMVRDGVKYYGKGEGCAKVLNNFNMTVPKGTIYGLLGSSGCGKTTVLSCIVGLKNLDSGDIRVFGKRPGSKGCGVPGRRVGYMPQELALYDNLSIGETIMFFGTLANISDSDIQQRLIFLTKLLDLPQSDRRVDSLSCGQKRRVSLAVTLVHSPELLILDEPTVGVDPLLRESIWEHLTNIVSTLGTTVLITTHYIEEAQRSHTVGLMRNGRLLMEENPQQLLLHHGANSLNDIVLKLCRNDQFDESYVRHDKVNARTDKVTEDLTAPHDVHDYDDGFFSTFSARVKALTLKNSRLMLRNYWLILLILLNPSFDVCLVNTAMGGEPSHLPFGYVNHELNSTVECERNLEDYETCILANLSCRLIDKLRERNTFRLKHYESEEIALRAVDEGRIWGYVSFPEGYSDSLFERATEGLDVKNESMDYSNMNVRMDVSNKPIAVVIAAALYEGYGKFIRKLLADCGLNPEFGELPVKFLSPLYGSVHTDMKEFVAPGILLGILFFFPYCSGALVVINEKKQGTLQRAQVAGASTFELMISFMLTQTCVLLIQSLTTFFLTTWYFGIMVAGSIPLGVLMSILVGIDGVSMGFFVAAFCNGELEAVIVGIGYFLANFIISGTLWPIEAGPPMMQYFAYLFPSTLPGESVRSIISRGWGLTHAHVWPGFLSEVVRIGVFWGAMIGIYKVTLSRK